METLENPTASSPPSQTPESGEDQNPNSAPSDRSDPGSGIQEAGARISNLESAPDQGRVGLGSEATVRGIEDGGFRVSAEGAAGDEKGSGAAGSELKVGDGDSSAVEGVSTESCGEEGIRPREDIAPEAEENKQGRKGDVLAGPADDGCPQQSNGPFSGTNVDSAVGFHENSSGAEEVASVGGANSKESSSSGVAAAVAADVCVAENAQDRTGDICEEVEMKEDEMIVEAPASLVNDKMQVVSGDADARHQVAPEPVAVGGEEVTCKEKEVEMVDGSDSAEGKEGVASESSLPAVAEAIAADACLTENGQDPEVLDEKQNTEGDVADADITSLDEKQQIKPEIEAVDGAEDKVPEKAGISVSKEEGGLDNESGLSAPAPVPEKVGISVTEGEGGLNNESGLPAPSPAAAADVCLPENGQDLRAQPVESHTSVPDNEKAQVMEATVSIADVKQNTGGDAGDVGTVVSDGKQQTAPELGGGEEDATSQGKKFSEESILGHKNLTAEIEVAESESSKVTVMDVCLPENGQEPGSEVVEMHIESDVLVVDEKHNSAGSVTVHGAVLSQQIVLESVTGEREQIAVEGNGSLGSYIVSHQDSCSEIEVTEPVSAPAAVTEGEMMTTHKTVLEITEGKGNEAGKPAIDLIDGKQNPTHDAIMEGITSFDEKQQSAMDVSLPENRQNPGAEVSDVHVDNSDACLDDKLPAATVDGEQQLGTISAASEIKQVTEEGGLSDDGVPGHDNVIADIEVRKSPQAEDMAVDSCLTDNAPALGDEFAETQRSVPEMVQAEVVESREVSTSPSDMKISSAGNGAVDPNQFLGDSCPSERKQSTLAEAKEADVVEKEKDVDNVPDADISVVDKKGQQIVTKPIAGEEKAAAEKDQPVEDGVLNHSDAGVEAMEINALMPGAEENEEDDEVEEDDDQADEEEDQFSVGDFVWGKIKSHPWWPGLIYDPSDASDFARKYRRRDRLLVAYFGDGTFAWCYPSQLRPFNKHFERMMKQSSTKSFLNAVEEALSELSRCVESEMTCSCVSEEKKVRLAQPLAVNAGIKEGTTVPQGHIDDLSINEFDPPNFIGRLKDIAPVVAVKDTLELTVLKSRLSAFYGAKGYSELPTYHLPRGISDSEEDARNLLSEEGQPRNLTDTPTEEDWASPPIGPGAGKSYSSDKRLQVSEDKIYQRRKRSVAELMADHIDMEFVNERPVKDEAIVSDRPATSKDHKKTKLSAAEEEDSDFDKDLSDEGKSVGKSASSSKKRKKGKHLDTSHSTSDVENDDAGEEAAKVTSKSAPSSKKRKNIKHSASSPSTTAENKISDVENDDSGEEEVRTLDKCAPSSKTRKKTKHSESSPPSSPDNKVTFDDEINDGGSEEGAVLSSPRNRRRSRYLTAPYTMLAGQKSIVSTEDSETGNVKSPMVSRVGASISKIAVQLTGASQIVKSGGKKFQKKVSKEPNFENKTPGTAGPQTARRNRKTQALKEEDVAADEMFSDALSTPSDSVQPKGGRKGKSSVAENDSYGNDPYELKFGEKRVKEKEQTSSKNPKRKSRKSSVEDTAPHSAALLLTFEPGFALPSKDVLIEVFSKYGVLNESETEVMKDSGCAQVVFARSSDAEEAFNSSDKDTAFKPATVSYRLRYLSTTSKVSEPDSPTSAAADGTVTAPATENLAETQPLLYMQQSIESMMSLLSKFTGKEPGQAAKLTPTVRADLTVELGCLLQKAESGREGLL
ncbi:hypothetical protein ACLOJK_001952 [Asimina triloba]